MILVHICSLALFFVILFCWAIPKKLYFEGKAVFFWLMLSTLATIIFDIFFTSTLSYGLINQLLGTILFKIYCILLYLTAYFQFLFLVRKSFDGDLRRRISLLSMIAPAVAITLILIFNSTITVLPTGIDIQGLGIYFTYGSVGLTAVAILYLLIKRRKVLNTWYLICYGSAVSLWVLFSIIQFCSVRLGYVSLGLATSVIPIFAFIENPLNYTDYKFSCFKNNYIERYLKKLIDNNSNGFVFLVAAEDTNILKTTGEEITDLRKQIIKGTADDRNINVFITEQNEIFITGENSEDYLYYKDKINILIENFYKGYENQQSFRALTISCGNIRMFSHETELIDYFRYTQNRLSNNYYYNTTFEITDNNLEVIHNENAVKTEIMNALEEDRLEAFIQPIYSVEQKRIISAESLARIRRTDGTIMTPNLFIPIAESCGLDILIGIRIVEKVCQFLHDPVSGRLFDYIDINLSIAQCESSNLASRIISIAQKYDIKPSRLNFEITETGFINKMSTIEKNIRALTDYGFGFSLDDFGNGESNLNYLINMPVSYVKLDMHMIWDYFKNEKAKKTVQTIIKISHGMNLQIVAEGVENAEQYDELAKESVDLIQGYYFYKPMSFNDYLDIVKKEKRQSNLQDSKGSDETMDEKKNYKSFDDEGKGGNVAGITSEILNTMVSSISSIFLSMYLFDRKQKTVQEFTTFDNSRVILSKDVDIQDKLNALIKDLATDEWKDKAIQFADLASLSDRLNKSPFTSLEFIGNIHGWVKSIIIPIRYDAAGNVESFWYLVQHIDDDKKRIKMLEELSFTDELTGLPNRRAFDKKIDSIKYDKMDDFVVISFDINNLKYTNDNFGHHAGDEIIRAAGELLRKYLLKYGHIFRTGGDEFIAILNDDYGQITDSLDHMMREVENWRSKNFEGRLSIAYGVSTSSDISNGNFYDYEKFAETRMFKNKSQYYVNNNIDRRKSSTDRRQADRRQGGDRRN